MEIHRDNICLPNSGTSCQPSHRPVHDIERYNVCENPRENRCQNPSPGASDHAVAPGAEQEVDSHLNLGRQVEQENRSASGLALDSIAGTTASPARVQHQPPPATCPAPGSVAGTEAPGSPVPADSSGSSMASSGSPMATSEGSSVQQLDLQLPAESTRPQTRLQSGI